MNIIEYFLYETGLNQTELATKLNTNPSEISRYKRNATALPYKKALEWAEILNLTIISFDFWFYEFTSLYMDRTKKRFNSDAKDAVKETFYNNGHTPSEAVEIEIENEN